MSSRPTVTRTAHDLPVRDITEPDQLRALAHPLRLALVDLLMAEGPLTATECAQRLDDSPASCSYHLRQLERFGFVEDASESTGRDRPWRWVPIANRFQREGSPARQAAAAQLDGVLDAQRAERVQRFRAEQDDPWVARGQISDWSLLLTEQELEQMVEAVHALVEPYQRRTFERTAPDGSRRVDVIAQILPRGRHDA